MIYLLDAGVCIALMSGQRTPVRGKYRAVENAGHTIVTSTIVSFELWYGVAKSAKRELNTRLVTALLGAIPTLDVTDDDARAASNIRAALAERQRPIGAYDLLLAGQAVSRNAILATTNGGDFSRVAQLTWENWAR